MANVKADELKKLVRQKDEIEGEIKELMDVLESQKGVGLKGQLVDDQDFPRADVDIYTVKHSRQRVLRLQTDHKQLMTEIEEGLHELHREARLSQNDATSMEVESTSGSQQMADLNAAFVKVDRVDDDSPAHKAGLHVDDMITQFGSITKSNFQNLGTIGQLVQNSKNNAVTVGVIRAGRCLSVSLTPKTWSGRGLLGCNIVPIK